MTQSSTKSQPIFLIDSLGAGVSVSFLLILYRYEELIGMPSNLILFFTLLASGLSVFSASLYLSQPLNWPFYLRLLALLNTSYGLITLAFVIREWSQLTPLGVGYFGAELLVILILSAYELRLAGRKSP